MSILQYFEEWKKKEATFYNKPVTKDSANRPVNGAAVQVGTPQNVFIWVTTESEQNDAGKWVNVKKNNFVLDPPGFDITNVNYAIIDGVNYYVEGFDNIAEFDEVLLLKLRRDFDV